MNGEAVALVGAGPWGLTLARALRQAAEAELAWICDLDGDRRARAAGANPGARLTADIDQVLRDPRVRAVAVAVDSPRHHQVGLRVLEARRHLYVEKPLALETADAARLHAAASYQDRVLTVGHLLLFHPAIQRAAEIVAAGVLGEPLYFESMRETVGPPRTPGSAWWALAPHDVSLAIYLFGAVPTTVSATAGGFTAPEHDGIASATLRFADGRTAYIHVARFAAEGVRRLSIAGTRRTLIFDELAPAHPLAIRGAGSSTVEPIPVATVDPLLAQCRHFVACARAGNAAGGNGAHWLAVVRVLAAGARSIRAGGVPVEVA
jgi:predicted dehydrogenase